jgi:putative hydrolase
MVKYKNQIEKYRMTYDIHTHTTFSHGKGTIEDNVKEAVAKGLTTIGISDHGPGHLTYGVKRKKFSLMRKEIQRLEPIYPQINILLGVEANIINPSGKLDIHNEEWDYFDYVIAGYHYGILGEKPLHAIKIHTINYCSSRWVKNREIKQKRINTDLVVKALYENNIKVLTHPGDKGQFDLLEIAKACVATNTLMEISNWHEAPLVEGLKECAKTDVSFIISSDAHLPKRVGTFSKGLQRAFEAGIDPERIVNIEEI